MWAVLKATSKALFQGTGGNSRSRPSKDEVTQGKRKGCLRDEVKT